MIDVDRSLEELAANAANGDRDALNELLRRMQHPMYRLALRFLGNQADAEDATQDILIRLTTHLSTFEGRSKFTTWSYTVAIRMLLRARKGAVESSVVSAEKFSEFLDVGLAERDFPAEQAEYRELLGDILGVTDVEGAEICETTPAAFRQRLARGRRTIRSIIDGRCGLMDERNPCRCGRQIQSSLEAGLMDRTALTFVRHQQGIERDTFERVADQIETVVAIGDLYRRDRFAAPYDVWQSLRTSMPELIDGPPEAPATGSSEATEARPSNAAER
jgi:DNA-directed RNA polymerase specialized sigma24 family protein